MSFAESCISKDVDSLLVVACPSGVSIGAWVVGIIQFAGAGVHVLGTLSEQVGVAFFVFVALLLAILFVGVSLHVENDTSWGIADTLVVSVLNWSLHNLLVVAGPLSVAISSWVRAIVELAGTAHVRDVLASDEE